MKDKIKVIFTGGTIGSLANAGNIKPNEESKYMLLEKYEQRTNDDISRFDTIQPISILSENAVLLDVLKMSKYIAQAQEQGVKGIIMTHGSDTLAFSSAYLSLLLPHLKVPVVLVASNLILTDKMANGVDNFMAAVKLIDDNVQPNVYVAYKNPEDEFTSIHLGARMMEPPPYSDSFYSPMGMRFAVCKNGVIKYENTDVVKTKASYKYVNSFTKKCLYITPHTGLNYDVYKTADFDYVLHNLYHSGTANTREDFDSNNLIKFAEFCQNNQKPLYLCNIKKKDVNYDSTNQMKEKNIKFLYDILPNVALAKLNIAYNLIEEDKKEEYLNSNINGEILQASEKTLSDIKEF